MTLISKKLSFNEFLIFEEQSAIKHEFHQGKIIEMSGAKLNHNLIAANIIRLIGNCINAQDKNCLVLNSDQKTYIETLDKSVYPDITVLCEAPQFYENRQDTILNPMLLVEVLSKSTEAYDRGDKFHAYCTLPSFKEYVLVSQDKAQIETWYLQDAKNNLWRHHLVTDLANSIELLSINCLLSLQDIYQRIQFEDTSK